MSFTDHKITQFAHRVADLPDEPQIPADELKSRFDACPEELRQSLNAVCDDAARLEARVEGIVVDTFGDSIDKSMLSDELAAELDAKAVETSVASRFTAAAANLSAEQTARESADTALQSSISSVQTGLASKCEVYAGNYMGDGASERFINLGFTPDALLLCRQNYSGDHRSASFALNGFPGGSPVTCTIEDGGFRVYAQDATAYTNVNTVAYLYLAFRFTRTSE